VGSSITDILGQTSEREFH